MCLRRCYHGELEYQTLYHELGEDYFDVGEVTEIRRRELESFTGMIGGDHLSVGLMENAALMVLDLELDSDFFRRHHMSVRASTSRVVDDQEAKLWSEAVRGLLTDIPL